MVPAESVRPIHSLVEHVVAVETVALEPQQRQPVVRLLIAATACRKTTIQVPIAAAHQPCRQLPVLAVT